MGEECTVVYAAPFPFIEDKPGSSPSTFTIPAAEKGDFNVLVVEEGIRPFYVDYNRGNIEIPVKSEEIAAALVNDFKRATLSGDTEHYPAIFYIKGGYTKEEVESLLHAKGAHAKEVQEQYKTALEAQDRWFNRLVRDADDDWQKFRSYKNISGLYRIAAKYLNLDREWAKDTRGDEKTTCVFCTEIVPTAAVVCPNCHNVLDRERFEALTTR